jgi:tetratricopeptide (TPR) repeat protein
VVVLLGDLAAARAPEKPKPLVMEDSDLRELADLVAAAALKDSSVNGAFGMMMIIRPLLPELEKRVPARAAQLQLRLKLAEMDKMLDPSTKAWAQYESIMSKPPEGILEEAAKAPAETRGQLYMAAASKLFNAGEVEKARAIANENLRGQERDQLLAFLDNAEVERAVGKGNTDDARAVVSRIKSKERRASALAGLALAYAAKGDRKTAGGLLEEARSLLDRQPDNEREVEALLEVARGYALVEPAMTFELIDPLIDQANDMMSAAALLEKFGAGAACSARARWCPAPAWASWAACTRATSRRLPNSRAWTSTARARRPTASTATRRASWPASSSPAAFSPTASTPPASRTVSASASAVVSSARTDPATAAGTPAPLRRC